jgi:hypothetical protein
VSEVPQGGVDSLETLNDIASGQRQVMYALLAQILVSATIRVVVPQLGLLLLLTTFIYGAVAVLQLAAALKVSVWSRVLLCIGLLIPLVSLLVLALLSGRASRRLRAGGFKVGLLGAKAREA